MTGMKQYLLSIYQPDGDPPPPEILEPIMKDIEARSEEHTSEIQSRLHLVCRLLLEQKTRRPSFTTASYSSQIKVSNLYDESIKLVLSSSTGHPYFTAWRCPPRVHHARRDRRDSSGK